MANSGYLVSSIIDIVETPSYRFAKLDTGLTEIVRPAMYGAHHSIIGLNNDKDDRQIPFVFVGHCCESGDLISCEKNKSDALRKVQMSEKTKIGDLVAI